MSTAYPTRLLEEIASQWKPGDDVPDALIPALWAELLRVRGLCNNYQIEMVRMRREMRGDSP